MNIIPVIRDLLLRNKIAVIPGLGSFVMAQKPAQMNKVTRVITPPSVTVKFDRNKQADDGQLTGYLTRKLTVDKEAAVKAIEDFRTDIEEKLNQDEKIILEGLGTLSKKPSGDIAFSPEEELLKRISLFEMPKIEVPQSTREPIVPPVSSPPLPVIPRPSVEKPSVEKPSPVRPSPENVVIAHRRSRLWVIPVILLFMLVGMLSVVYFTGNMDLLISDIKSFFSGAKEDTTQQIVFGTDNGSEQHETDTLSDRISKVLDEQVNRGKALSYEEATSSNTKVENQSPAVDVQNVPQTTTYAKPYHVISGSFTVLANAEKQRSALKAKGLDAEILPKKGKFYMVSLGSFDSPEQASAARQSLQQKAPGELWVMKNK